MRARNARRLEARSNLTPPKGIAKKLILAAVVLAIVGMIPLLAYGPLWSKGPNIAKAPGLRTVIVIDGRKANASETVRSRQCHPWLICRNGKDGIDVVVLKSGKMLQHPTTAVVQTDTDCAADVYGDSHCTNQLRLANGQEIVVRHDHNMQIYPCLTPGEVVEVKPKPST